MQYVYYVVIVVWLHQTQMRPCEYGVPSLYFFLSDQPLPVGALLHFKILKGDIWALKCSQHDYLSHKVAVMSAMSLMTSQKVSLVCSF